MSSDDRAVQALRLGRLGDGLQGVPGQLLVVGLHGQVAQGDDPDHAHVPVQDRQPADLLVLHQAGRVGHVLVFKAEVHGRGHGIPDAGGVRVGPGGRGPHGHVAVGDHPDQPVVVAHGHRPDVEGLHPHGRSARWRPGTCTRPPGSLLRSLHPHLLLPWRTGSGPSETLGPWLGVIGAAENDLALLHPVADHLAPAVGAGRGQGMDAHSRQSNVWVLPRP